MLRRGHSARVTRRTSGVKRINRLSDVCRKAGMLVSNTRGVDASGWVQPRWDARDRPAVLIDLYTEGADTAELHPSLLVGKDT